MVACSVLASLNLPAAIEDTSGTELPQSLLEKAAYVRDAGGIQELEASMKELPDLLQRNKELLDEVQIFYIIFFLKTYYGMTVSYIFLDRACSLREC